MVFLSHMTDLLKEAYYRIRSSISSHNQLPSQPPPPPNPQETSVKLCINILFHFPTN